MRLQKGLLLWYQPSSELIHVTSFEGKCGLIEVNPIGRLHFYCDERIEIEDQVRRDDKDKSWNQERVKEEKDRQFLKNAQRRAELPLDK